jgi:SAM-dependent methyltransferase
MTPKQARKLLIQYLSKYSHNFSFYRYLRKISRIFSLPEKHSTFFGDLFEKNIINLVNHLAIEDVDSFDYVLIKNGEHYWPDIRGFLKFLKEHT